MGRQLGVKEAQPEDRLPEAPRFGDKAFDNTWLVAKEQSKALRPRSGVEQLPRLAPSSAKPPFCLSAAVAAAAAVQLPEVADTGQLLALPCFPWIYEPIIPLSGLPPRRPIPQGHSGLDLLQGGQIKPMVLLGLVCGAACAQLALRPAPLTSGHVQA